MERIIEIEVTGCHLTKSGNLAGVEGESDATTLEITFDESWDGFSKTIAWIDAKGENATDRILSFDELTAKEESSRVFSTKIPGSVLTVPGDVMFSVIGYQNGIRQKSVCATLSVRANELEPTKNDLSADEDYSNPTLAEILQSQISSILNDVSDMYTKAPPKIINGTWHIWDSKVKDYVDTGLTAKGDKGDQGEKGDDGYSPQRGTDYWTEEDKEEIRNDLGEIVADKEDAANKSTTIDDNADDVKYPTTKAVKVYADKSKERAVKEASELIMKEVSYKQDIGNMFTGALTDTIIDYWLGEEDYPNVKALQYYVNDKISDYYTKEETDQLHSDTKEALKTKQDISNMIQKISGYRKDKYPSESAIQSFIYNLLEDEIVEEDTTFPTSYTPTSYAVVNYVNDKLSSYETKTDFPDPPTPDDEGRITFDFSDMYNKELRLHTAPSITIKFQDNVYSEDYISGLSFDSGDTATGFDYADSGIIDWVGTDCVKSGDLSIFQPSPNTHYDIVFYFNGTQFIGLVNGFVPATGNR